MSDKAPTPEMLFCAQFAKNVAGLDWQRAMQLFMGYLQRVDLAQSVMHDPIAAADRLSDDWEGKGVPNFNQFRKLLGGSKQKPTATLYVTPPELATANLSSDERANVLVWLKALDASTERDLAQRLAIVRQCAERGFQWLVRENAEAARIARMRGWIRESVEQPAPLPLPDTRTPLRESPLWEQAAPVVDAVTLPALYQPPVAGPPVEDFTAAFQARHGRKPGALTPDALHEARMKVPGLKEIAERAVKSPTEPVDSVPPESAPAPPKRRKGAGGAREALPWH